jgi:hypothetical protein
MNDLKQKKQAAKIRKATEKFAENMGKKKNNNPPFLYLIWFSVFKASSVINQTGLPADYHFYKNIEYFTDYKLSTFQKKAINVFTRFFRFMINKGYV